MKNVEQKKFLQDHGLIPTKTHPDAKNTFKIRLSQGSLIEGIQIEKSETEEDGQLQNLLIFIKKSKDCDGVRSEKEVVMLRG